VCSRHWNAAARDVDDDLSPPVEGITRTSARGRPSVMDSRTDSDEVEDDARLRDLERAEEKRAEGRRLDHKFELFEAILLSLAAVLGAWTGYQAAKWSGVQANSYSQAGALRVDSTSASATAGQQTTVDVVTFTDWLAAMENEGLLAQPIDSNQVYVPDPQALSGFLYERFRPEFKVAVDAWVATHPRINPDAPTTPFVMPEYHVAESERSADLEGQAEAQAANARAANQRSDNYVLMTIMFATVLFFAGISSKMDTFRARTFLLGAACTILVVAIVIVASFPKEI
jgi:hypothetical protein